jgi:hypothetical protein
MGPMMSLAGTAISAFGKQEEGNAAQEQAATMAQNSRVAAEFEAKQSEYLANQAIAVSHAEAYQQRKAAALLASKALANAAASGGGATDPTVVDLISGIYAEGAYRSALAVYEGEEQARSHNIAAAARRISGESAANAALAQGNSIAKASNMSMFSTLLRGGSSMLDRYGESFLKAPSSGGGSVSASYGAGPFSAYTWE